MFEPLCFGELVGTIWSVEALSFNYNYFFFLRCQGNFSLPRYTMLATPESATRTGGQETTPSTDSLLTSDREMKHSPRDHL